MGEMLENGLRKAFPSMNKPPWIAVLGRVTTVVESEREYDMGNLNFLVFATEVCRFDGKEHLWRRKMSSWTVFSPSLSCIICTLQTLVLADDVDHGCANAQNSGHVGNL